MPAARTRTNPTDLTDPPDPFPNPNPSPRPERVDVAWLVGNSGYGANWELRYSLRSFYQNARFSGRVVLIGGCPTWVDRGQVWHVPCSDPYRHQKDANLIRKACVLAELPELSDPFILCSDDHLLMRPSGPGDFRYWHCGPLPGQPQAHTWRNRLHKTRQTLDALGCPSLLHFEGHIPYKLQKAWLPPPLDWQRQNVTVFSAILNPAAAAGLLVPEPIDAERVRGWLKGRHSRKKAAKKLDANRFAVLDNWSVEQEHIRELVATRFPEPAPWELDGGP